MISLSSSFIHHHIPKPTLISIVLAALYFKMAKQRDMTDDGIIRVMQVEVRQIQPKNRGLFAKTPSQPHMQLLELQPLVSATLTSVKERVCNWCLLQKQVFRCSKCQSFYYCSRECQAADWKIHKLECPIYIRLVQTKNLSILNQLNTQFVLNLRLHLLLQDSPTHSFFQMLTLQDMQPPEARQHLQELSVVLMEALGLERTETNFSKLMRQLNIVSINVFTVQDLMCSMDGIALALYQPANYINHSCQANCSQLFDGRYMKILSNCKIEADDQLTINYTSSLNLIQDRKKFLREHYFFQCFCELCQVEAMLNLSYILCNNCAKSTMIPQKGERKGELECTDCKTVMRNQDWEALKQGMEHLEADIELKEYKIGKKILFAMKKKVDISHPQFARAIETLSQKAIAQGAFEEAYILLKEQMKQLSKWYLLSEGQQMSIIFWVKYAQLGKLAYNLGKLAKADHYTRIGWEAINNCQLRNKYVEVEELRKRMEELNIEMSVAKSRKFNQ